MGVAARGGRAHHLASLCNVNTAPSPHTILTHRPHSPTPPGRAPSGPPPPPLLPHSSSSTCICAPSQPLTEHTCQPGAHRAAAPGPSIPPRNGGPVVPARAAQPAMQVESASDAYTERTPAAQPPPPNMTGGSARVSPASAAAASAVHTARIVWTKWFEMGNCAPNFQACAFVTWPRTWQPQVHPATGRRKTTTRPRGGGRRCRRRWG